MVHFQETRLCVPAIVVVERASSHRKGFLLGILNYHRKLVSLRKGTRANRYNVLSSKNSEIFRRLLQLSKSNMVGSLF